MTYDYEKYQYYSHIELKLNYNSDDAVTIGCPVRPYPSIKQKLANRYSISRAKIEVVHIGNSKIKVQINW